MCSGLTQDVDIACDVQCPIILVAPSTPEIHPSQRRCTSNWILAGRPSQSTDAGCTINISFELSDLSLAWQVLQVYGCVISLVERSNLRAARQDMCNNVRHCMAPPLQ